MPIQDRVTLARRALVSTVLLALLAAALPAHVAAAVGVELVESGFSAPVYVTHAGDARLFVVEQGGKIKIVGGGTFLDISAKVSQAGGERGLLGLAFHPGYASNGLLYVNYTRAADGDTVIEEYQRSAADPDLADPASARTVLLIDQPATNHNGGWMAFKNQNLFIAMGDGGGPPGNRAQDLGTLLGKILRIVPLDPDGNGPLAYSIPARNPYVGRTGRDEIWARGLRNPWRCSFDRVTGKLFCADVGQNKLEELNRSRTGKKVNYGWPLLEGTDRYPSGDPCTSNCKTLPIAQYSHESNGEPCAAITGGYVSRRPGAALYGKYVFADYCTGKIFVIAHNFDAGSSLPAADDTNYFISSFGEGSDGRLYLVHRGGSVYRLTGS
ncbi:PQQ-dependent sugar dehydrogenase [soil metagenome]